MLFAVAAAEAGNHQEGAPMSQDPSTARSLPAQGAFVVQFGTETDVVHERFVGRIEHVVSGQATHFRTLEDCLAFVGRVLAHVHGQPCADMSNPGEVVPTGSDCPHPGGRRVVE
jgi:hypothetical protein